MAHTVIPPPRGTTVVACLIFTTLLIFLYAIETRSSTFSTWTENVVLPAMPTMASTILETNSTLLRNCDNGGHNSSTRTQRKYRVFNTKMMK